MAKMIPSDGPSDTDSEAERDLYPLLREQLSDDFFVIHSLPWLTTLTRQRLGSYGEKLLGPPTGEIDFLILHAELGVLAIEVKGGRYTIRDNRFIKVTGQPVPVIKQVRHNAHGFANQFDPVLEMRARIGYAIAFPDSSFDRRALPPSLSGGQGTDDDITILMDDIASIGERVQKIMAQWVVRIGRGPLGEQRLNQLIELIAPWDDGEPTWSARIYGRDERWLRLTDEQLDCLNRIDRVPRQVVVGWPGTGKTVLAVETAKRAVRGGRAALFLTFNKLIGAHVQQQLAEVRGCQAYYFHELLREIRPLTEGGSDQTEEEILRQAVGRGFFSRWDVLIVDEGQALAESWHRLLATAFSDKRVYVFCDDAQRFDFEAGALSSSICDVYGMPPAFLLTHCLRNPFQISQLLQDLIPPAFQIVCQRPKETDVLTELVSGNLQQDLTAQLDALLTESIVRKDITVLYVYDRPHGVDQVLAAERFSGILCANVVAFRGMESRVVVLVVDRRLSSELPIFSAYSRATSRCIAIYAYDALRDALRGGEGSASRHTRKLSVQFRNVLQEMADELARESYFRMFQDVLKLEISSAHVYWHRRWRCWLVEVRENEPAGFFWADHLSQYQWRVVFKASRARSPYVYEGNQPLDEHSNGLGEFTYSICDECCTETGCSKGTGCLHCSSHLQPDVDVSLFERLSLLDRQLVQLVDGEGRQVATEELPISLVALGMARLVVARNASYVGTLLINGGTLGYSAASTILRAYIALSGKRPIDRSDFAKRFFRYVECAPIPLSFHDWEQIVASAFNIAVSHQVIDRVGKTKRYRVREPEQ